MSARIINENRAVELSDAEFFQLVFGHPPKSRDPQADAEFWAKRKREHEEYTARIRANTQSLLTAYKAKRGEPLHLTEVHGDPFLGGNFPLSSDDGAPAGLRPPGFARGREEAA